ncbi:hypothetical protein BegalDRAFT_2055 [Beggiatoa alba B18LD]|uniref:FlgO domain-containing protein n=1 Tax=Beggiatoa alba B18LD TaxID=395493 RepID=I3CH28_9GAMM|nr:FlgO family outer membrane protein [Beggiatoa alba]EIJ42921.1 hypothetical protein BegalDRAFT_2055 [Beggiatoa alba B18LD]
MRVNILLLIGFIVLTGCTNNIAYGDCAYRVQTSECVKTAKGQHDADIIATTYAAADDLLAHSSETISSNACVLVTSVADINELQDSTPLGRLLGEQLSVRLTQRGYVVREVKLQNPLSLIAREGEFALAREVQTICTNGQANIVAGTYAVGDNAVFITLKLLSMSNNRILAAHAYSLPLGDNTTYLLQEPKTSWW